MSRVKQLRIDQCISQQELANRTGLTKYTINRLELGIHKPKWQTLRKLAEYFHVEPKELNS